MNWKIIYLIWIAIAPLAFAQTNVSQAGSERSSKGGTTETTTTGGGAMVVNAFVPGTSIAVGTAPNTQPVNYVLSKDVQYVDSAGNKIDPSLIRPGTHVRLETTDAETPGKVNRIVLVQPE